MSTLTPGPDHRKAGLNLSNKAYDTLKWIAQIFLPAAAALYVGLTVFWPLPYPTEIAGTIIAIDTFLGVLLGIAGNGYASAQAANADGTLKVDTSDPLTDNYSFEAAIPLEELRTKKTVTFKVEN